MNLHYKELGKFEPLSKEQELELGRRIQESNDKEALDKLVNHNLRFVVWVANKYVSPFADKETLIGIGNQALIDAAKRFDPEQGNKFISYAVGYIKGYILNHLREHSNLIRIPENQAQMLSDIRKVREKYVKQTGYAPSIKDLSVELQKSPEKIEDILLKNASFVSMSSPIEEGAEEPTNNWMSIDYNKSCLEDILGDENSQTPDKNYDRLELAEKINEALDTLDKREADIIKMYYGIGHDHEFSLPEIAKLYGLTPNRIVQIKDKAIRRLRHPNRNGKLMAFLNI